MAADQPRHLGGVTAPGGGEDALTTFGVGAHDRALCVIQARGIQQHVVRNADLADVMEAGGQCQMRTLRVVQIAQAAQLIAEQADPVAVETGVLVAHLQRHR
ncbi:hypothetical protein D3C81_1909370 [compost metagenome]